MIDFILPTCPGIPESMWLATSAVMDALIKICWKLFGGFLAIRFIKDGFVDVMNGRFELRTHLNTVFQAVLIGIFLSYYKFILMSFDNFIDMFCISDKEVLPVALGKLEVSAPDYEKSFRFFSIIKTLLKGIFDLLPKLISIFSHAGAIAVVHYFKAIALLIASQFGPLAALFYLLPGPFKKGFSTWAKSYINISCWAITLNLFWVLSKAFSVTSFFTESNSASTLVGETAGHAILSFVFFIAIFLTPVWTSKFIGSAIVPNLGGALDVASKVSKIAWKGVKGIPGLFK